MINPNLSILSEKTLAISRAYKLGLSMREIAEIFDCSPMNVKYHLDRAGTATRDCKNVAKVLRTRRGNVLWRDR